MATGETSSNLSRMTVFVSRGSVVDLLNVGRGLPYPPRDERALVRRLLKDEECTDVAYSGNSWKLCGVTTTPNVPGLCVAAFLSRSSSDVSTGNSGRSSGRSLEVGLVLCLCAEGSQTALPSVLTLLNLV